MPVHNGTGVLRKVLLCPSTYYELVPVDDYARTAIDRGDKVDHGRAEAQHNELADYLINVAFTGNWRVSLDKAAIAASKMTMMSAGRIRKMFGFTVDFFQRSFDAILNGIRCIG